jgi:hypothetical protein
MISNGERFVQCKYFNKIPIIHLIRVDTMRCAIHEFSYPFSTRTTASCGATSAKRSNNSRVFNGYVQMLMHIYSHGPA